jgi:Outer membrane protein beta-barrel domain
MLRIALAPICAGLLLASPIAAADLYLSGSFSAVSSATGDATGKTDFFDIQGTDSDSAPAYGGTIGIAFPMDEALPAIKEFELPSWVVRGELEFMMGRDYELRSDGAGSNDFFTEVNAWTLIPTVALEVPVREPVRWLFGRVPILELMSITGSVGVGVAQVNLDVTDNVSSGSQQALNFAWQGGLGLSYELTDTTTFTFGWRYVSLGTTETDLKFGPGAKAGNYALDLASHEFTTGLRVNFYTAPLQDMNPRNWHMPHMSVPGWVPSWMGGPSDTDEASADDL